MKKRKFIKLISKLPYTIFAISLLPLVGFNKIKKKIYKKKFSKVWILDINDS
ncbi:hypothetical protein N9F23_01830 [Candidatus Pelagibacter sp.]|jgi:hypothetical protein|nr:hypothetical protein [Candidatus Pelagibacter sp.]|tara:strand:+ start:459 stop:614 length:156 start_codon:yes stop_codon:yes gene_type:complete